MSTEHVQLRAAISFNLAKKRLVAQQSETVIYQVVKMGLQCNLHITVLHGHLHSHFAAAVVRSHAHATPASAEMFRHCETHLSSHKR